MSYRLADRVRTVLPALLLAAATAACVETDDPVDTTAEELLIPPLRLTFAGDAGGDDGCNAIAARADGSFVVTGELGRLVQGHNAVTRAYSATGALQWSREVNTPSEGHDQGNDVLALADDTAITAGHWLSGASGYNYFLQRIAAGAQLWWRESALPGHDRYLGVAIDSAGSLYAVGQRSDGGGGGAAWVRKLAADGETLLWEDVRDGTSASGADVANKVAVDPNDEVYVVGYVDNTATGTGRDGYISKFKPNGTWVSRTWLWTNANDEALDVAAGAGGAIAVVAKLDAAGSVRKYAGTGALAWATTDPSISWRGVAMDASGDVYATGVLGTSMVTRRHDGATGATVWTRTQTSATGESVAIDGSGRVLVCGSAPASDGGTDGLIIRYTL